MPAARDASRAFWRRTPLLLRHHRLVALAIAGAGLVLALSGTAAPLFLSSAGNGALSRALAANCPSANGVQLEVPEPVTGTYRQTFLTYAGNQRQTTAVAIPAVQLAQRRAALLNRVLGPVGHLQPMVRTWVTDGVPVTGPTGRAVVRPNTLVYRDGQRGAITVLSAVGGSGVWLTDTAASQLGVRAGETVTLGAAPTRAAVRVVGIYRDLGLEPPTDFWCTIRPEIFPAHVYGTRPPPLVLASDLPTLKSISARLGSPTFDSYYERRFQLPLTVPQAAGVAQRYAAAVSTLTRNQFAQSPISEIGPWQGDASTLGFEVSRARSVSAAIAAPVTAAAAAGSAAALLLVIAAAGMWVERRRGEISLLATKGIGPVLLGAKATLEMTGPFLLGAVAGWGVGVVLVPWLGPSSLLNAGAPLAAATRAGLVAAAGLAVLWVVAGLAGRRSTEKPLGRRRSWSTRVPWELALLAAAVPLYLRVRAEQIPITTGVQIPGLTTAQLLFPLLFIVGAVLVGVRLLGALLRGLATRGRDWPIPAYLAGRRLSGAPGATLLFVATAAIPIGVLILSAALTATLSYTTEAKAEVFVGSDTAALLYQSHPAVPAAVASSATRVERMDGASIDGYQGEALAVDPATFARAAFWDSRFSDTPLPEILRRLRWGGHGAVPVVTVGAATAHGVSVTLPDAGAGIHLATRTVAHVSTFPGLKTTPMVILDQSVLGRYPALSGTEIWVRGPTARAEAALASLHLDAPFVVVSVDRVSQAPQLIAIRWTFGFLEALGGFAGVIAVGALLLYLQTRSRRRRLAYAFARRMGLSRGAHRRSLLIESATSLGAGYALGAALAIGAVAIVYRFLDPEPYLPPGPLFVGPVATLAFLAAGVAVLCVAAAGLAQRSVDRGDAGELLRLGQ